MSIDGSFSAPLRRCRSPPPSLDVYSSTSTSSTSSTVSSPASSSGKPLDSVHSSPATLLFGPLYDALERHTSVVDQFPDFDSEGRSREDMYLPTSTASGSPSPPGSPQKTVKWIERPNVPTSGRKPVPLYTQRTQTPLSIKVMQSQSDSADSDVSMLQAAHTRAMEDVTMLSAELHNARRALNAARARISALEETVDSLRNLRSLDARLHTLHLADHARRITALRDGPTLPRQRVIPSIRPESGRYPESVKEVVLKCPKCSFALSLNPCLTPGCDTNGMYGSYSNVKLAEAQTNSGVVTEAAIGDNELDPKGLTDGNDKSKAKGEDPSIAVRDVYENAIPDEYRKLCRRQRTSVTTDQPPIVTSIRFASNDIPSRAYSRTKLHAAARSHVQQAWLSHDKRPRVLRMRVQSVKPEQDDIKMGNQNRAVLKATPHNQSSPYEATMCSGSPHTKTSKMSITISTINARKNRHKLLLDEATDYPSHEHNSDICPPVEQHFK